MNYMRVRAHVDTYVRARTQAYINAHYSHSHKQIDTNTLPCTCECTRKYTQIRARAHI